MPVVSLSEISQSTSNTLKIFLFIYLSTCSFADINVEPIVEMRWDFTDCGQSGRFGPTQIQCDDAYKNTNLEGDVKLGYGVQTWSAPMSGLYLITAKGASGLSVGERNGGRGAAVTSEFRLEAGEELKIIVGQRSDYDATAGSYIGPGGSGGTFITRTSDGYILMVAGGGSSSAGRTANPSKKEAADASFSKNGKNASIINGEYGTGGKSGSGGFRGFIVNNQKSTSGGGAGFYGDGNYSFVIAKEFLELESPSPSIAIDSNGVSDRAPGVGGFFMFYKGRVTENNGGFGGGGSGSVDGGSGGGGGYSGGGGGPYNGWGGGGGSINNGKKLVPMGLHLGKGSVSITFTGSACCGPVVVYAAAVFFGGIILTVLCIYSIVRLRKYFTRRKKKPSDKHESTFPSYSERLTSRSAQQRPKGHENEAFAVSSGAVERKDFYRPRRRSYDRSVDSY